MNLEEIAKLTGVSRSTVSRVVNEDPNVSVETRTRVMEMVRRMNYQPNAAARSLAAGRTRVLGLVIPERVASLFTDPYFPLLIQGISAACNAKDHSIMLWLAEPEYERRTIHKVVHSNLIDGVVVASALNTDPVVEELASGRLPFLMVGHHPSRANINYVDVDNATSTREAVTHLLRLGRRRVATVTGPQNMIAGVDRKEGYLTALRQRGVMPDPSLIVEGDFTEAGGYVAMQRLLPLNPDAVFAASDITALGVLRALREAGRRVPDDVAVVGFDDMPFAAHTDPPLTTVRQPIYRTGMMAAETLIDVIENPSDQPRRIILPTEMVIRASCGSSLV